MDDFGNLIIADFWCNRCRSWQVFEFENWGICDWCAMEVAFK